VLFNHHRPDGVVLWSKPARVPADRLENMPKLTTRCWAATARHLLQKNRFLFQTDHVYFYDFAGRTTA